MASAFPNSLLFVVPLASVPVAGNPANAVDAVGGGAPVRFRKPNGYNAVEFGFPSNGTGSGDYALFRYWPEDMDWKPEGPRGATPTTIDQATVSGRTPVRISTPAVEYDVIVVLCAGAGIAIDAVALPATIEAQNR